MFSYSGILRYLSLKLFLEHQDSKLSKEDMKYTYTLTYMPYNYVIWAIKLKGDPYLESPLLSYSMPLLKYNVIDFVCVFLKLSEMCSIFMPPLKMGGTLFCNYRSLCRSVEQVLYAQYLLTPSLDQYQTWCRGCPHWVDDPYWFSGHMFKGQGQTTLLSPLRFTLNIFWLLHLINTKLGAGVALNE